VAAIEQVIRLRSSDVMCAILPFFHSFGYTVTLWGVLALDIGAVYHFSPLDARQVGTLCREHKASLLMTTPTSLRSYVKRCPREDFVTLDVVVTGAEKLPPDLIESVEEKFGFRPVEGYGITELSPLVSVNVPPSRALGDPREGLREGSVGRPVPEVLAKVVHPETHEDLSVGQDGLLWIKGPNVMLGYLNQPEATAKVIRDGWYNTGDIAHLDAEGFITITGRLSRFSKIGGEMVPHIKIEETLLSLVAAAAASGATAGEPARADSGTDAPQPLAVCAVADERKGERLVVLHVGLPRSPGELCREMAAAGLPNLWIPSPDSFCQVSEIPILGTGKLDLQRLKALAEEKFGTAAPAAARARG
jgi:acyl-[acyl-carrier-protein]-phospholipid O-acyltransferase/long-chain-fatty-acid--[acyl-carrier-protein] ligase